MKLVVLGAGGHAREVADVVRACRAAGADWELEGFLDDDPSAHGRVLHDAPVLGGVDWLGEYAEAELRVVSGIGSPVARRRVVRRAEALGASFVTLVHPTAVLTPFVTLGVGTVITAGVVLTNSIRIGEHVHINRCATVGHDCTVGDFVHLAPGSVLSGNVMVEEGADVGTNACVIQNKRVGAWSIVGAGASVVRDVARNVTVVGVPARVIKTRNEGWHEG